MADVKVVALCAFVTAGVLMFLMHAAIADVPPLRLNVSPSVSFAPATVQIQIRLQPDDADRWISVGMDNGEYRRTSGFTIEPDRRLYAVSWRDIPAGEYQIQAAVGTGARTRASASARIIVSGP